MKLLKARFNQDGESRYASIQFQVLFYGSYITTIDKLISNLLDEIERNESVSKDSIIFSYANIRDAHFKDIQYESLIISMYSFFEKSLFLLCKISEKEHTIKVADFSKKGIFKYKQYLEKVIDLDFNHVNKEWELICSYNKLRNYLVHSPEKRNITGDISNILKHLNGIAIIENDSDKEFTFTNISVLTDLLDAIKKILDHLNFEEL